MLNRSRLTHVRAARPLAAGIALAVVACSSADKRSGFDPRGRQRRRAASRRGAGFTPGAVPCQGLECKRVEVRRRRRRRPRSRARSTTPPARTRSTT